jgi:transcription antitermination factor NusG
MATGGVIVKTQGIFEGWPEDVLDGTAKEPWLVAHANPRQEKRFVEDARAKGIPGCIFLERRLRRYHSKGIQESVVPLLGGYLFLRCGRERQEEIFRTNRIVRLMDVDEPAVLREELRNLRTLVTATTDELMVRPEIHVGDEVSITFGAFEGFKGIVVRREGISELVVNLPLLGSSVATRLPADLAERLDA